MNLTIAYVTNRKDCRIQWFFDSLHNDLSGNYEGVDLLVVDFFAQAHLDWKQADVDERKLQFRNHCKAPRLIHVPPKPTVWQGPYRLAKYDFFAAANMRNTAICLASDGYLAFVDDLSVLLPGWIACVRDAMSKGIAALGAFRKVYNLLVQDGKVLDFRDNPIGHDSRLQHVQSDAPVQTNGGWFFGCSLALPLEALLSINGFDEDCDSMSGEDYICGIMLERAGLPLFFYPKMMTLESEELHFIEKPFRRIIKPHPGYTDSSHAILDWVRRERKTAPNYQNMRVTRELVRAGNPFPAISCPEHDWRDKQPIREMDENTCKA